MDHQLLAVRDGVVDCLHGRLLGKQGQGAAFASSSAARIRLVLLMSGDATSEVVLMPMSRQSSPGTLIARGPGCAAARLA